MKKLLIPLAALPFLIFSWKNNQDVALKSGMTLTESVTLRQDTFLLAGADSLGQPILTIEGENITVDFNGAVLDGSETTIRFDDAFQSKDAHVFRCEFVN